MRKIIIKISLITLIFFKITIPSAAILELIKPYPMMRNTKLNTLVTTLGIIATYIVQRSITSITNNKIKSIAENEPNNSNLKNGLLLCVNSITQSVLTAPIILPIIVNIIYKKDIVDTKLLSKYLALVLIKNTISSILEKPIRDFLHKQLNNNKEFKDTIEDKLKNANTSEPLIIKVAPALISFIIIQSLFKLISSDKLNIIPKELINCPNQCAYWAYIFNFNSPNEMGKLDNIRGKVFDFAFHTRPFTFF